MEVSVAMAVYNGGKYLNEQIESIIPQLTCHDELVISYNESNDNTWDIISQYSMNDTRIRICKCDTKGVIPNFQNAIKNCKKDIILLSDQDDVWMPNKIKKVLSYFSEDVDAVAHSCELVDKNLCAISKIKPTETEMRVFPISILKKNYIQGSCLAFRRKFISGILPFPNNIPMHDSWIGMIISTYGKMIYVDIPLIYYRQHEGNVTSRKHKKINEMISDRIKLLFLYLNRCRDIKEGKNGFNNITKE